MRRCILPVKNYRIFFCDVILADIFTSYAKVFGDLWLSLLMLLPGGSLLVLPPQEGWSRWILPTLMRSVSIKSSVEITLTGLALQYPLFSAIPTVYGRIHGILEFEPSASLQCHQIRVLFPGDIPVRCAADRGVRNGPGKRCSA
jgi:hypothetical protein